MSELFTPYNLAFDLDQYFINMGEERFGYEDFINLAEAFQLKTTEDEQNALMLSFKTLSKKEVIIKIKKISKLNYLLKKIKKNALSTNK